MSNEELEERVFGTKPAGQENGQASGLPTEVGVVLEDTPEGTKVPALYWGPIQLRRMGWTLEDQDRAGRLMLAMMAAYGVPPEQAQAQRKEWQEGAEQLWWKVIVPSLSRPAQTPAKPAEQSLLKKFFGR